MAKNRELRVGDTVRVTSVHSRHRHEVGVIESFTDGRFSARVRWLDGSTNAPEVTSLTRQRPVAPPQGRATPSRTKSAGGASKQTKAERASKVEERQVAADVRKILEVLAEIHDLMAEDARAAKRCVDQFWFEVWASRPTLFKNDHLVLHSVEWVCSSAFAVSPCS